MRRGWLWVALMASGVVAGGGALMYYRYHANSNRRERQEPEQESSEETIATMPLPQEEPVEEVEQQNQQEVDQFVPVTEATPLSRANQSMVVQTGTMFLTVFATTLMVIVLAVAFSSVIIHEDVSSPFEYRMFGPLMYIALGILTASFASTFEYQINTNSREKQPAPMPEKILDDDFNNRSRNRRPARLEASSASHERNSCRATNRIDVERPISIAARSSAVDELEEKVNEELSPQLQSVVVRAEELYVSSLHIDLRDWLIQADRDHPNQVEILWRLARVCNDLIASVKKEEKQRLAEQGLEYAKAALAIHPNSADAHKWMAIMMSTIGGFRDTKQKIAGAFVIRDHIKKAIELNPRDATSRNILGQWCLALADMTWIERQAAAALFGTPPKATYEEAVEQFLAAESISPGFWKKNSFLIAQTYHKMKNKEQARLWIIRAKNVPIVSAEDKEVQGDIEKLLSKL